MEPTREQQSISDPQRRVAVACPQCKQGYRVAARLLGRRLVCRHCRSEFRAQEVDSDRLGEIRTARPDSASSQSDPPSDSGKAGLPADMPPSAGAKSIAIDTSLAGQKLGRYQVLSILGQGGMGVVWRGHDDTLRRDVALKILNRSRKSSGSIGGLSVDLFMQEARAVAKLQHPAVVSIFEVAQDNGQVFLALELMEGGTLKEYVDRHGRLTPRELFRLLIGPAKALALAHQRGIIHRDIKPGNLMFDDHGHLKLMDFGLADVSNELASERIRGKAVGSLGWIAPETARGEGTTPLSDIYGMGLVILYALTGRPWLHAKSRSKLIALHQKPPALDVRKIDGLTATGEALLRRCLAVEQSDRFVSASELVKALQQCADEDPAARSRRRMSNASLAVAAALIGLVLGVAGVLYYFLDLAEREDQSKLPAVGFDNSAAPPRTAPADAQAAAAPARSLQTAPPPNASANDRARAPWPQVPDLIAPASVDGKYVGTKNGKVYHLPTTQCGRSIFASNLRIFDSIEAARAEGREFCSKCRQEASPPVGAPK